MILEARANYSYVELSEMTVNELLELSDIINSKIAWNRNNLPVESDNPFIWDYFNIPFYQQLERIDLVIEEKARK